MILLPMFLLLAGSPDPAAAASQPKGDERVCKPVKVTGSRLSKGRRCMKRSEWEALSAEGADYMRKLGRESNPSALGGGNP